MRLWRLESDITQRHGIHHAWCGLTGPAGLVRTLRMVPPILDICHDVEDLCPAAWLLNYANPVSRLGFAISRYSTVSSVGLCHALAITTRHLAGILGVAPDDLQATAAGINHFSFIVDLRFREGGADAYPILRQRLRSHEPADQPLSRATFEVLGL
jgi:alpha-galactosidase